MTDGRHAAAHAQAPADRTLACTAWGRWSSRPTSAASTSIDGPEVSFSQARRTEGRLAAEREALADARRRADEAAASQGQRVTEVRSIELDPGSAAPDEQDERTSAVQADTAASGSAPAAAATPVLPGRDMFRSAVRVVYLLEPAA